MPPVVIVEELWRKICQNVIPTCWWTATFRLRFTSKIQLPIRRGIPGNRYNRPSFRWACNPMCKSKLRSEECVLPTLHWERTEAGPVWTRLFLWRTCTRGLPNSWRDQTVSGHGTDRFDGMIAKTLLSWPHFALNIFFSSPCVSQDVCGERPFYHATPFLYRLRMWENQTKSKPQF